MRTLLDIYLQQFKTTLASQLQYRAALLIWTIGHVLEPVIYLVVWSTVAQSSGGRVGGYVTGEFCRVLYHAHAGQPCHVQLGTCGSMTIASGRYAFVRALAAGASIHADIADNVSFKLITFVVMLAHGSRAAMLFRPRCISFLGIGGVCAALLWRSRSLSGGMDAGAGGFWTTRGVPSTRCITWRRCFSLPDCRRSSCFRCPSRLWQHCCVR